jgi:eukaryotic-like serine/threonine-protein kinase
MSIETRALAVVEEALGVSDPVARASVLDRSCSGNTELRARVDHLLSFEGTQIGLLTVANLVDPLGLVEEVPDRIGPYRITGEIARGGMGAVFKAERDDGVFQRTVAIKLIRADLASERAQRRFAEERRMLARLDNPGIVRIIDGGESEGRPWLAMDFVDGVPVTELLERRSAARDERLDAFEAVCAAVAYAHRSLVIHADIKPSNILMDGQGKVHLLDFGIARLIVDLEDGVSGDPYPLTKGYAAPERAVGLPPTIASDVFSLGVLLLGMLGCKTPAPDSRYLAGTRLPVGQLEGDLAAIAAKALAEDPAARYPDVAALAEDIRRHRTWIPVVARQSAGWRYPAGRFIMRHRRGLSLACAAAAALIGATVISSVQYVRAERARAQADARFLEVRQLAQFMLSDLSDAMVDSPGTVPARARLAEQASRYLAQLRAVPEAPLDLRLDAARGYRRLATMQGLSGIASLGLPDAARKSLDQSGELLTEVLRSRPNDPAVLEELGWVEAGRWTLAGDNGDSVAINQRAAKIFAAALQIDGTLQGARLGQISTEKSRAFDMIWNDRPAEAVAVLKDALGRLRAERFSAERQRAASLLEVTLLNLLGDATYYAGDKPGSLGPYREASAIVKRALATGSSVVWLDKLGDVQFNIGGTLAELPGQSAGALVEVEEGIAAMKQVLVFGPDATIEKRLLTLDALQGQILADLGRSADAIAASNASLELRRQRLLRAPRDPQRNRDLAVALPNHALVLARGGKKVEACNTAREAQRQWQAILREGNLGVRDAAREIPAAAKVAKQLCGD